MLQFKNWLEHSYRKEDIPQYFFLAFEWRPEELKQHRLVGVKGISGRSDAIIKFVDGCALVLDGVDTEKINDLSRVLYNNPHYMASKGFEAAKRVMDWDDRQVVLQLLERLFLILFSVLPIPSQLIHRNWYSDVIHYVANKIGPIKDFPDFLKKAWNVFSRSKAYQELPLRSQPNMQDFFDSAEIAGERVFTRYSDEKEWRVKPSWRRNASGLAERIPIFNIPYKSLLLCMDRWGGYNFATDIRMYKLEESYDIHLYDDEMALKDDLFLYGRNY